MNTALVLVLSALSLALAAAAPSYSSCSSGCDVCQPNNPLPVVRPRLIRPPTPTAVYRTVYREAPAPAPAPCEIFRSAPAPAPAPASCEDDQVYREAPATYDYDQGYRAAPRPSCRTSTSCKTKNVVEVVKTMVPRYHLRNKPVRVCTTCRTCEKPISSCDCAKRR